MIVRTKLNDLERFYFRFARDLPQFSNEGIQIRVDKKENGRLCIVVEPGEKTTSRELHTAVPLVMQWRDRLNEFQGRIAVEQNSLLLSIQEHLADGKTYAEIAEIANLRIAEWLCAYSKLADADTHKARRLILEYVRLPDKRTPKARRLLREHSKLVDAGKDAFETRSLLYDVREILAELNAGQDDFPERRGRYSDNEKKKKQAWIDDVIEDALEQISQNQKPFDRPDFPISPYNIEYTVREWRRKRKRVKM